MKYLLIIKCYYPYDAKVKKNLLDNIPSDLHNKARRKKNEIENCKFHFLKGELPLTCSKTETSIKENLR